MLLTVALQIYPDAEADEIGTFIYNNGGNLYSRTDICNRLKELKITRRLPLRRRTRPLSRAASLERSCFGHNHRPLESAASLDDV